MVPSACVGVVVNGPQCMCGGGGEWSPVHVWGWW